MWRRGLGELQSLWGEPLLTEVDKNTFSRTIVMIKLCLCGPLRAVAYRGGVWGAQPPPPPKFQSFDKAAFDGKLSGKCLVFLFPTF